ncbi:MAG: ARMT1-like domain-containing protein [Kiritimatiellia bacterium]
MKAKPDCIACMFKQALNTARVVTDDPAVHLEILRRTGKWLAELSLDDTPAGLSQPAYEIIAEVTGNSDPYYELKKETNRAALAMLDDIRELADNSGDPLDAAMHAAVAGNVIDLGIGHKFDIEKDVKSMMKQDFAINALDDFKGELGKGKKLLYLGDNAGEIVFDRLLAGHILKTGTDVTFTVKSGPIINDATREDAETAGLTAIVRVIETGAADIGVNWNNVSPTFTRAVRDADLILAKGHGNFETCSDRPENFYFLLKAKCDMVAREIGCKLGDLVLRHSPRGQTP